MAQIADNWPLPATMDYSSPHSMVPVLFTTTWDERLISVGIFCFIGALGALLNMIPPALTLCTKLGRNEVNIMISNLSSAELMLCCSFLFGQTFYILWHEHLPPAGCHFLSFFHFTMAYASFIFPPFLAINRFVSLYYNHIYRRLYTKRNVWLMMFSCWIFCAIVPLIFTIAGKTGYDEDNHHCCMVLHGDVSWSVLYWVLIIAPLVLFCDGSLIYCNYRIYQKLNSHAAEQTLDKNVVRKNAEILYFLLADMMFPICFHSIYHIFKFILQYRTNDVLKRFFISLYLLNSVMRGLVTLIMLRPYRVALKKAICSRTIRALQRGTVKSSNTTERGTTDHCSSSMCQSPPTERTPMRMPSIKRRPSKKRRSLCQL